MKRNVVSTVVDSSCIIISNQRFKSGNGTRVLLAPFTKSLYGVGLVSNPGMALTEEDVFGSTSPNASYGAKDEHMVVRKVPTGIADLDSIVDGGFPSGSAVLLCGDIGAGMQEFAYTAASKIAIVNQRPEAWHYYLGDHCDRSDLPAKICYITFARSRDTILQELATSFNPEFYYAFRDCTVFKDFSSIYYRHSVVPSAWTQQEDVFDLPSSNILEELVDFLEEEAQEAIVIIDSLTDLAVSEAVEMKDLVTAIKGLQRAAKRWNGLVYLLLTRGILERRHEQMLMDSTDGCLVFEWKTSQRSSTRQRYMYLEKFTGVLPHLPRDKIARFPTMISSNQGLVVVFMERIS
jgi:KaiC/GvpD/RAD55 family RecA-like ATPase